MAKEEDISIVSDMKFFFIFALAIYKVVSKTNRIYMGHEEEKNRFNGQLIGRSVKRLISRILYVYNKV